MSSPCRQRAVIELTRSNLGFIGADVKCNSIFCHPTIDRRVTTNTVTSRKKKNKMGNIVWDDDDT